MNTARGGGVRAKICGLTRRADAELAAAEGASFAGVVLAPGGPRSVVPAAAAALLADLPQQRVGVFVNSSVDEVVRAADTVRLDVIQLHGDEDASYVERVRERGVSGIWKAVRPRYVAEFEAAIDHYAFLVDGLLLDGWSAAARGGSGTRFPWEAVAAQRHTLPAGVALVIAGGLRADNVTRAVTLLRPDIVDVSSGVEHGPGVKDPAAIRAFMRALQRFSPEDQPRASHA